MRRLKAFTPATAFVAWAALLPRAVDGVDYYKLLGITEFADADEVKKAYRKMSLKYHPDKFQGDAAEAQDIMVKLNDAFKCLKDPNLRRMYEYYENDYESMLEYEKQIKKERVKDLYLYDSSVHIIWSQNIDRKFKPLNGLNHTWVLNLYHPSESDCKRQASEFKTFGRIAEKRGILRAGAINCELEPGLCHKFFKMVGSTKDATFLIFPTLQPDENDATDFEEFDIEEHGWPTAKELERRAMRVASNEVIQIGGGFLEQNITRNPRAHGVAGNATDERVSIWAVWFYHGAECSKTDACDRMAPGFRRLSNELRGLVRFAAINCKEHARSCRGQSPGGASGLRLYVQRGTRHFVESFTLDHEAYNKHKDAVALAGAAQIFKLLVKPAVEILYPPHPFRPEEEVSGVAAPGSAAAAADTAASGGIVDLTKLDPSKMKVSQLKNILAAHGERCVGCADKGDFVSKVREIAARQTTQDSGAGGEL